MNRTIKELAELFNQHQKERICVLGTTCCGKSTLQQSFPEAVDMDEALWPTLTKEEEAYICQKPWTNEIGKFTSRLVKERVIIQPGHPLFSLILLECDVIIYLNISDELLAGHCEKRGASLQDAKNVKRAIEKSVDSKRADAMIRVYDVEMEE